MQEQQKLSKHYILVFVLAQENNTTAYSGRQSPSFMTEEYNYCLLLSDPKPRQSNTELQVRLKMWLLRNSGKFLRQSLCTCLAGFCPLLCYFCLQLLNVYEIGITPNFEFEFCNCATIFFTKCIAKFLGHSPFRLILAATSIVCKSRFGPLVAI